VELTTLSWLDMLELLFLGVSLGDGEAAREGLMVDKLGVERVVVRYVVVYRRVVSRLPRVGCEGATDSRCGSR
jgi:hypothetical protein